MIFGELTIALLLSAVIFPHSSRKWAKDKPLPCKCCSETESHRRNLCIGSQIYATGKALKFINFLGIHACKRNTEDSNCYLRFYNNGMCPADKLGLKKTRHRSPQALNSCYRSMYYFNIPHKPKRRLTLLETLNMLITKCFLWIRKLFRTVIWRSKLVMKSNFVNGKINYFIKLFPLILYSKTDKPTIYDYLRFTAFGAFIILAIIFITIWNKRRRERNFQEKSRTWVIVENACFDNKRDIPTEFGAAVVEEKYREFISYNETRDFSEVLRIGGKREQSVTQDEAKVSGSLNMNCIAVQVDTKTAKQEFEMLYEHEYAIKRETMKNRKADDLNYGVTEATDLKTSDNAFNEKGSGDVAALSDRSPPNSNLSPIKEKDENQEVEEEVVDFFQKQETRFKKILKSKEIKLGFKKEDSNIKENSSDFEEKKLNSEEKFLELMERTLKSKIQKSVFNKETSHSKEETSNFKEKKIKSEQKFLKLMEETLKTKFRKSVLKEDSLYSKEKKSDFNQRILKPKSKIYPPQTSQNIKEPPNKRFIFSTPKTLKSAGKPGSRQKPFSAKSRPNRPFIFSMSDNMKPETKLPIQKKPLKPKTQPNKRFVLSLPRNNLYKKSVPPAKIPRANSLIKSFKDDIRLRSSSRHFSPEKKSFTNSKTIAGQSIRSSIKSMKTKTKTESEEKQNKIFKSLPTTQKKPTNFEGTFKNIKSYKPNIRLIKQVS